MLSNQTNMITMLVPKTAAIFVNHSRFIVISVWHATPVPCSSAVGANYRRLVVVSVQNTVLVPVQCTVRVDYGRFIIVSVEISMPIPLAAIAWVNHSRLVVVSVKFAMLAPFFCAGCANYGRLVVVSVCMTVLVAKDGHHSGQVMISVEHTAQSPLCDVCENLRFGKVRLPTTRWVKCVKFFDCADKHRIHSCISRRNLHPEFDR